MPLFRTNRPAAHNPQPPAQSRAELIAHATGDAFSDERRTAFADDGFVAICLRPQVMLGALTPPEIDLAGHTIATRLRADDGFDLRDDGSFVVVLAGADRDAALIVAQRLANEITRRTAGINQRKWVAEIVDAPPTEVTGAQPG